MNFTVFAFVLTALVTPPLTDSIPPMRDDMGWYLAKTTISHSKAVAPLPRVTGHLPRNAQREARIYDARYSRKAVAQGAGGGQGNQRGGQQGGQMGGQGGGQGGFQLRNISQLFGTIDDRRVGEMPNPIALLGGNR